MLCSECEGVVWVATYLLNCKAMAGGRVLGPLERSLWLGREWAYSRIPIEERRLGNQVTSFKGSLNRGRGLEFRSTDTG